MRGNEAEVFPSVEWPVVLIDGSDVGLFEQPGDLQALEDWMADQEGFEFYDAKGRRLRSFVALYGVDVMVPDASESHANRIVKTLREYLHATGENPQVPSAALKGFIAKLEATQP